MCHASPHKADGAAVGKVAALLVSEPMLPR